MGRTKYSAFRAFAVVVPLLAGCARGPLTGPPKPPSGTFTFPSSKGEIEEGYEAYYEALAPYGTWLPEASWGVRFCPTVSENGRFRPYVDGGHWSAERPTQASVPGAGNADSPYWVVDEGPAAAWSEVTTHHGWWVNYEAEQRFCWVPGTQATDGRVVWRAGNGFVGWAPEPPAWVDDGGDSGLPWVFTFLASLYFPAIGDDCIGAGSPEYERVATVTREVQRPQRDSDAKATGNRKSVISRRGPGRSDVGTAKLALAAFAATGPTLPAPNVFSDPASRRAETNPSRSDSGTEATSDAAKKKKLVVVVEEDLRPSLVLPYLLVNPPQGRFLPNLFAPSAAALDVRSAGGGAVEEARPAGGSSSWSSNTRSWEGPSAASSSSAAMSSVSRPTTTKSAASSSSSSSSRSSSRTRTPTPETSKASTTRPTVSVGRP